MFVLVHVSGKLYRELEISLQTGKIIGDQPLTRLDETDLEPSHEWTEPPGLLTFYISRPGYATIFGGTRTEVFPPGLEVDFGTDKSDLSGSVDRLRNAAEDFRKAPAWTTYLNDIDPTDLRDKLSEFRPQYDWSRLADFTDDPHRTAWEKAAASDELRTLAFYGRSLYDTLFANDGTSRSLIEKLPPGQFIHIVWRQDSGAPWVPHLPWALLYMGDVDNNSWVDATLFWGLRFRLQHTAYKSTAAASNSLGGPQEAYCTNLLFFGQSKNEPATAEAEWQRKMWSLLSDVSRSWIVPDERTTAAKAELLRVLNAPEAAVAIGGAHVAVLYLFCHYGKDASGNSLLRFGLDASNPDDILREPELGTSAIASHPLVFANACATAGTDVYTANAITKSFFTRAPAPSSAPIVWFLLPWQVASPWFSSTSFSVYPIKKSAR